jgi:type II secretory pathway component PulF
VPLYDYSGQVSSGALFHGTLEAGDVEAARTALEHMGVRVGTIQDANRAALVAPLSLAEFTFFNEQLAAMTRAGLPLDEGLRQLAADTGSRKLKRLVLDVASDLAAGQSLPQALERQARRFPTDYASVVRAGLQTGDLAGVLYGLAAHLRMKCGFRRALLEVVTYPLVVMTLALFVASFLMRSVVPLLSELLTEAPRDFGVNPSVLESAGPMIFSIAAVWPTIEAVLGVLLLMFAVVSILALMPGAYNLREQIVRRLPGVAQVYWSSVLARFTHASALAAFSGTPLPELIRASGQASGSPGLARSAERVAERLVQGDALSAAAAHGPDVPALWTCAIETAAPRGELAPVLSELARTYELRAQQSVSTLRAVLGPVLFILMAVLIGGLIAGLLSAVAWVIRLLMSLTSF